MTAADYAHAAIVATLVGFVATLVIADHIRERRTMQALLVADMRARDAAERTEHVNEIQREVTDAFDAARDPWHTTRAEIRALPERTDR